MHSWSSKCSARAKFPCPILIFMSQIEIDVFCAFVSFDILLRAHCRRNMQLIRHLKKFILFSLLWRRLMTTYSICYDKLRLCPPQNITSTQGPIFNLTEFCQGHNQLVIIISFHFYRCDLDISLFLYRITNNERVRLCRKANNCNRCRWNFTSIQTVWCRQAYHAWCIDTDNLIRCLFLNVFFFSLSASNNKIIIPEWMLHTLI